MPRTEPNSLPGVFDGWLEWRASYASYVREYREAVAGCNASMEPTYGVRLKNRLSRLGFVGNELENELKYIKEGGN